MGTILITGFEPFGGDARNPSAEVAAALDGRIVSGRRIVGAVLPCVFQTSVDALEFLLATHDPELVIALGLAADRSKITPERIAVNLDSARIPDNAGAQPFGTPVIAFGPSSYLSTLPIPEIVTALADAGIPSQISHSAGRFVCNHLFYGMMHHLRSKPEVRAGFIHIPSDTTIPFPLLVSAIEKAVEASLPA